MQRKWSTRGRVLATVAAALVASAAFAVVAEARANPSKTIIRETETHTITSPCSGNVVLQSRRHFVFHGVDDGAGGVHVLGHVNEHHTGTDSLGGRYVGSSAGTFTLNAPRGATAETSVASFVLVRKGEGWRKDDKHVHSLVHVTTNAKGQITAVRMEYREICR